jgi:hypothetical protein
MEVNVRYMKGSEIKEFVVELDDDEVVENDNTIPIKLFSEISQEQFDSVIGKARKMLKGTEWEDSQFANYWI